MPFAYKSTNKPGEIAQALRALADRIEANPLTPAMLSAYADRVPVPADVAPGVSEATGNLKFSGPRVERLAGYVLLLDAATQQWLRDQLDKTWSELRRRDTSNEPPAPPPLELDGGR
jgi:hypothetical protein